MPFRKWTGTFFHDRFSAAGRSRRIGFFRSSMPFSPCQPSIPGSVNSFLHSMLPAANPREKNGLPCPPNSWHRSCSLLAVNPCGKGEESAAQIPGGNTRAGERNSRLYRERRRPEHRDFTLSTQGLILLQAALPVGKRGPKTEARAVHPSFFFCVTRLRRAFHVRPDPVVQLDRAADVRDACRVLHRTCRYRR
jgi:hypothetical protein